MCCSVCRSLPGSCTHACLLLCHPGPCPPCPLLVNASCFCGKATLKQRCGNNAFSCRCAGGGAWVQGLGFRLRQQRRLLQVRGVAWVIMCACVGYASGSLCCVDMGCVHVLCCV
jgi:hypothetical protein